MVDELAGLFVGIHLHGLADLHALFLAARGVDLVKDALQLIFQIVHAFGPDHVEDGRGARHVGFDRLVVEAPGAQILTETTAGGRLDGRRGALPLDRRGRGQQQIEHALFGQFPCARHHALFLLRFHQLDAFLHQVAHDRLDVAAHVAHFGELRGFGLDEGRVGEFGQATGDFGLTHARGPDHENVLGGDFRVQRFGHAAAAPAVAQSHGHGALGLVLADDVLVEFAHDFSRREHGAVGFVHSVRFDAIGKRAIRP